MSAIDRTAEWLEADGLGGFASGTVGLVRTRRYHALLLAAQTPPTGRMALVQGVEAWVDTEDGSFAISAQRYQGDVVHPDGAERLVAFTIEPWPTWTFELPGGVTVVQELCVPKGSARCVLAWRLREPRDGVSLRVRPLLSGRDYHALHHENGAFRFDAAIDGDRVAWPPYDGVPAVVARSTGCYVHEPCWYRRFDYAEEAARGLDHVEDLASPGTFRLELGTKPAFLTFAAHGLGVDATASASDVARACALAFDRERERRAAFGSRLLRSADDYVVARRTGKTVVAGYPWFTDWGRDTFISLRGLCIATGRLDDARDVLVEWAGLVSEGMLPNRFADGSEPPEFNSVDASLWFVTAAQEYIAAARAAKQLARDDERVLGEAILAIVRGYSAGTRFGIRRDRDGLLAAGVPGVQLTWMDAKVGAWVVTPRIGKPVEVQALWLNALRIASKLDRALEAPFAQGLAAFRNRFWNEGRRSLHDVVDVEHVPGRVDESLRPNQIFAVGGLPFALLEGAAALAVVNVVERELLTPIGLRSLARGEPGYAGRYAGDVRARDGSYHQGTVWPWLLGPFVEAWVRVRGGTDDVKQEARERFVAPFAEHLACAGLGHVSEVADGDPPHRPGGCPFQAWSLAELLRLEHAVLAPATGPRRAGNGARRTIGGRR